MGSGCSVAVVVTSANSPKDVKPAHQEAQDQTPPAGTPVPAVCDAEEPSKDEALRSALESYAFFRSMQCKEQAAAALGNVQQLVDRETLPTLRKYAIKFRSFTLMQLCTDTLLAKRHPPSASNLEAKLQRAQQLLQRERRTRVAGLLAEKERMEQHANLVERLTVCGGAMQTEIIQLREQLSREASQRRVLAEVLAGNARHFQAEEARLKTALRTLVQRLRACAYEHAKAETHTKLEDRAACGSAEPATADVSTQTDSAGSDGAGGGCPSTCCTCRRLSRRVHAFKAENRRLSAYVLETLREVRCVLERQRNCTDKPAGAQP